MRSAPQGPIASEAEIQAMVAEGLKLKGYTVLVTSMRSFRSHRGKGSGSDKGIPDLLITHKGWPAGVWLGVEMKKSEDAKVSAEQKALAAEARIVICWNWEQVEATVKAFDSMMGRRGFG